MPNCFENGSPNFSQREGTRILSALISDLQNVVGRDGVIRNFPSRAVYECDAYTLERAVPDLVVLPRSPDEVARVVGLGAAAGLAMVPRGAGTSLAGGCLARTGSLLIALSRMREIEILDTENRQALVQAGVVNATLSRVAAAHGLHFAPDPSSQQVCTVGGNIANNSGGPHTLKYGVTTNHVLAVELVTPDGKRRWLGSRTMATGGLDLTGLTVGCEGTFGIVTRAWVRLTPTPPAVRTLVALFPSVKEASEAVSMLVTSGVVPAAVEMMDSLIITALREAFKMEFPENAKALLLVEVDGVEPGLDEEVHIAKTCCQNAGAFSVRQAADEGERSQLWSARKRAFGALGRFGRNFCTQDGVVPRTKLPEVLNHIQSIADNHRLRVGNVFHAGDGNLHPILLYDERDPDEVDRVLKASKLILEQCLKLGGSLTGEHGIGVEKLGMMGQAFGEDSLFFMRRVRKVFDPDRRANPDKAIPYGEGCTDDGSLRGPPARQAAL